MEIVIKATAEVVNIAGIECRLWEGVTSDGTPCKVFVHRIGVRVDDDNEKFERELIEKMPPANPVVFDLRFIL